jgi:hypothetical protein
LDAGYEKLYSCKFGVLDYVYKHQDENEWRTALLQDYQLAREQCVMHFRLGAHASTVQTIYYRCVYRCFLVFKDFKLWFAFQQWRSFWSTHLMTELNVRKPWVASISRRSEEVGL